MRQQKRSECTICSKDFAVQKDGGIDGYFGVLAVSFCLDCCASFAEMLDMIDGDESEE